VCVNKARDDRARVAGERWRESGEDRDRPASCRRAVRCALENKFRLLFTRKRFWKIFETRIVMKFKF